MSAYTVCMIVIIDASTQRKDGAAVAGRTPSMINASRVVWPCSSGEPPKPTVRSHCMFSQVLQPCTSETSHRMFQHHLAVVEMICTALSGCMHTSSTAARAEASVPAEASTAHAASVAAVKAHVATTMGTSCRLPGKLSRMAGASHSRTPAMVKDMTNVLP